MESVFSFTKGSQHRTHVDRLTGRHFYLTNHRCWLKTLSLSPTLLAAPQHRGVTSLSHVQSFFTLSQGLHGLSFKNIGTGTETGKFQQRGGRGREEDREGEGG